MSLRIKRQSQICTVCQGGRDDVRSFRQKPCNLPPPITLSQSIEFKRDDLRGPVLAPRPLPEKKEAFCPFDHRLGPCFPLSRGKERERPFATILGSRIHIPSLDLSPILAWPFDPQTRNYCSNQQLWPSPSDIQGLGYVVYRIKGSRRELYICIRLASPSSLFSSCGQRCSGFTE